ncbi:MAG: hypothetical protein ACREDH_02065 [Methylocella sp.]
MPHELFSNEMRDLRRTTGLWRAAGEGFPVGNASVWCPEILQWYVTPRRPAAAREFELGLRLAQRPQ